MLTSRQRRMSALVIVHPNWYLSQAGIDYGLNKYNSDQEYRDAISNYFESVLRLTHSAVERGTITLVTWLRFYKDEFADGHDEEGMTHKIDLDEEYDDLKYLKFHNALAAIKAPNYQFNHENDPADSIGTSILRNLQNDSKIIVTGGHEHHCVADTIKEIHKMLPRTRLIRKYLF